ncbi:proline-rich protein 18 [Heterodontus francisci]|uniref:proline-rich protein 18 n=1 Tax=Heterodontus francisci TaxID=7792 RepID=UPI00355C8723
MRTDAVSRPHRAVVPFPPIRQQPREEARRETRTGQSPGLAPPAGPPGGSRAVPGSSFSNSWPEATLQLGGRRLQPRLTGSRRLASSSENGPVSSSGDSARRSSVHLSRTSLMGSAEEVRFSLSLTPEAVLVIQRRSLERQLLEKGKAPTPLRCKKLPARPPHPGSVAPRSQSTADIRSLVKISLLNDQHKYDDVEYEEEAGPPDQALLQRCMEWLQGVESGRETAVRLPQLVR